MRSAPPNRLLLLLAVLSGAAVPSPASGVVAEIPGDTARPEPRRTLFVDSEAGQDANDGRSEQRPWRSLKRVNAADLKPGDTVRFKCGGAWRGSLVPHSGDETGSVTYTSYGQGPKPLLLGSLPRSRPEDWVNVGANVWATPEKGHAAAPNIPDPLSVDVGNLIFDHGKICGWKKWSFDQLNKPYDHYYDAPSERVYLYCEANPAMLHRSLECAMKRHVVNQGDAHHVIYDGLAVNNLIWNCEYSFEYWNHPETSVTRNIRFVNNTCVSAGTVWSHAQRPDRNGSHLMFYSNTAATTGFEVKHNIFCGASEWGSRYSSGWKTLPEMDHDLWFSREGVTVNWFGKKIAGFEEYRRETGLDANSRFADPKFVDAASGDYRLAPNSPARAVRPDGGPVGAVILWNAEDR